MPNSKHPPATAADVQATWNYIAEISARSLEIGTDRVEIAAYSMEIGTDMKEIAGYSMETRIAFMEDAPDWSKIATYTPEIGNYRKEMAGNALEPAARSRGMTKNIRSLVANHP